MVSLFPAEADATRSGLTVPVKRPPGGVRITTVLIKVLLYQAVAAAQDHEPSVFGTTLVEVDEALAAVKAATVHRLVHVLPLAAVEHIGPVGQHDGPALRISTPQLRCITYRNSRRTK